ncbi:SseB family protein, partial [Klebsiella pneumoniae]|uniref:SseB family protein n=1 Tax=Klebsiella pneumoniae TaxID=573 RepID=UPI0015E786C1
SYRILAVQAPDGQPATPIFTAPERVAEAFPGMFPLCLKGSILLTKMRGGRVIVDPGQPYGLLLSPDELDHVLGVERTASILG